MLADAVAGQPLLWRVTLTEFARWWRWRNGRSWEVVSRLPGEVELRFEDWDASYPMTLEIVRGEHAAIVPITGPRMCLSLAGLAYERRRARFDAPHPTQSRRPWSWKQALRKALDWETITPVEELPDDSFRAHLKRSLRRWRAGEGER